MAYVSLECMVLLSSNNSYHGVVLIEEFEWDELQGLEFIIKNYFLS